MKDTIKLDLPESVIKTALAAAITDHLGSDKKDALVSEALANILEKDKYGQYGLEKCFNEALSEFATDLCRSYIVDNPDVFKKLEKVIHDGIDKILNHGDRREKLVDEVATTVGKVLLGHKYFG